MAKSTSNEQTTPQEETVEQVKAVNVRKADSEDSGISVEQKLVALYSLQQNDSQVDKIRIVRGELPLEVEDLEDEIAGLQTRIEKFMKDVEEMEQEIAGKKHAITDSQALMKKYEEQQSNVRNNREYDSLTKEIEFQNLEIQLSEKRIKEHGASLETKKAEIERARKTLEERTGDLEEKKNELDDIVAETEKEEVSLIKRSEQHQDMIEERLLTAYKRIRQNARNGLAVVQVERNACGGCFSKIPPQRHLDIRMHKKIIVCEYCGRILVDEDIAAQVD